MTSLLPAIVVALISGVIAAAAVGPLLRRVPEPQLEPDEEKLRYAALATARTAAACLLWATALAFVAAARVPFATLAPWLVLAVCGAIAAVIDIATTWIPRSLCHGAWALAALATLASAATLPAWPDALRAAIGAAGSGGLFWLVYEVAVRGERHLFGFADVRLAFLAGAVAAWHSWSTLASGLLLGTLIGAVWGVVTAIVRRRDAAFPYGPSIVLGPFAALLVGLLSG